MTELRPLRDVPYRLHAAPESWMRLAVSNAGLSVLGAREDGDLAVLALNETCHITARRATPAR